MKKLVQATKQPLRVKRMRRGITGSGAKYASTRTNAIDETAHTIRGPYTNGEDQDIASLFLYERANRSDPSWRRQSRKGRRGTNRKDKGDGTHVVDATDHLSFALALPWHGVVHETNDERERDGKDRQLDCHRISSVTRTA